MNSEMEPEKDAGAPKLTVTREQLDRLAAARNAHAKDDAKPPSGTEPRGSAGSHGPTQPKSSQFELDQLIALFGSILGLGSFFLLPLRYALLTLGVALLAASSRIRNAKRWGVAGLALSAFAATALVWTSHSERGSILDSEEARARVRLEIVNKVNSLRFQHHLKSLRYDPALSLVAQQRADFGAAAHSGFATEPTAGNLPSSESNVWGEMAGVACSWQRLFEIAEPGRHDLGPDPEIGFIDNRGPDDQETASYLSPDFGSIGVGVERLPAGQISVVMDFVGRPKPGLPWSQVMPNLLTEVAGVGLPDCD
jgi:hypothetical protein